MKYWEIIAKNSQQSRLELGLRLNDSIPTGEQSGLLARQRDDGKRFVVRADEKLTAFVELESGVRRRSFVRRPR